MRQFVAWSNLPGCALMWRSNCGSTPNAERTATRHASNVRFNIALVEQIDAQVSQMRDQQPAPLWVQQNFRRRVELASSPAV
jgi:hypothetical protein